MALGFQQYTDVPELTQAALDQKIFGTGLRYWYVLRENVRIYGHFYEMPLVLYKLTSTCQITERYAYQVLQRFRDVFWDYKPGKDRTSSGTLRIFTEEEVAEKLGVKLNGGIKRRFDSQELLGRSYRKYIWKHRRYLSQEKVPVPLSRESLAALTGISLRSQQRYDNLLGEVRINHLEVVAVFTTVQEAKAHLDEGIRRGYYNRHTHFAGAQLVEHLKDSVSIIGVFRKCGNAYLGDGYIQAGTKNFILAGMNRKRGVYFRGDCSSRHPSKLYYFSIKGGVETDASGIPPFYQLEATLKKKLPWLKGYKPWEKEYISTL